MNDALKRCHRESLERRILDLFAEDGRAQDFSVSHDGLLFDYSKTNIDTDTRRALVALTETADVAGRRAAMFSGAPINATEGRAVLHTALRNLDGDPVTVDGQDVMPGVRATLERMADFAADVRDGRIAGQGGRITDVVNIGIGGSDLGPSMAVRALKPYHDGPRCHFISNVDGADLTDTLGGLDPARTLVLVASKSFTTQETMANACAVRAWMARAVKDPAQQFAAISTAKEEVAAFGIPPERMFGFGDWVGGRYSVWGPIGLSLMISIGPDAFFDFLKGGQAMDAHFQSAEPERNMPVMLALVGLWHRQICGHATRAVIPYEQRLERLPAYLQQLEMESNGKRVAMDGSALESDSGPVVWGDAGTNGQHAFFQLLHQGTEVVPCEFLLGAEGHEADLVDHHEILVAHCLAQSKALMTGRDLETARGQVEAWGLSGKTLDRLARHRVFTGNRPSTTLLYPKLTPYVLGQIVALYEHRVFVEGVVLGINSFDQWGVELGKELAGAILPAVRGETAPDRWDGSTRFLLDRIRTPRTGE
ncbi:glucose-6-phosphate isomerase [Salinihabitans flavidus]|uniref:Glucose-6-phosphate isomerase n=1 Tax=Salinihabitans flavidus TaxID=569882 RepID=A0A1H8TXB9_9RHOB|nr:glucose-6-phosphate isomerase [Salinihabitans flavidus]SEO95670.1 glucose-6-phosphate isomerase [Salinihabitans flavidus]